MSLNWDATKCRNAEAVRKRTGFRFIVGNYAWICMSVGIGDITDKNVEEFYTRVKLIDGACGSTMLTGYAPTLADLRDLVGYHTNVGYETKAQFLKKLWSMAERYTKDEVRAETEKAQEEKPIEQTA